MSMIIPPGFDVEKEIKFIDILIVVAHAYDADSEELKKLENAFPQGYMFKQWVSVEERTKNGTNNTIFAVLLQNGNELVVAFRGTKSVFEWKEDFKMLLVDYPYDDPPSKGVKVEKGFLDFYSLFRTTLLSSIKEITNIDMVSVTGHSLGAAISTLAILDIIKSYRTVILYNSASPRVGNQKFVDYFKTIIRNRNSYRVVNPKDIVPDLPPKKIGYRHIKTKVGLPPNDIKAFHALTTYRTLLEELLLE